MLTPGSLFVALLGGGEPLVQTLVWDLRWPRAMAAFVSGGLLAIAGALMQILLRNPLADPYVLGVSGGASVGALLAIVLGAAAGTVSLAAFVGAMLSIGLVLGVAHGTGSWTPNRLLLAGVVLASGWGAVISFLLSVATVEGLPGMVHWLMGDLAGVYRAPWLQGVFLVGLAVLAWPAGRSLNILALGEQQAETLGVTVAFWHMVIFIVGALATAVAVSIVGNVGFVGLVVPHILRLSIGNDQRLLLPGAALLGGSLLVVADALARTVLAPQQLPVGVITAFLGVPLFLWLLRRSR